MSSKDKDGGSKEAPAADPQDASEAPSANPPTMAALGAQSIRVMKDASLASDADAGPKIEGATEEPHIAEETTKAARGAKKLSSLAHKIDPPIEYLPTVDGLVDK